MPFTPLNSIQKWVYCLSFDCFDILIPYEHSLPFKILLALFSHLLRLVMLMKLNEQLNVVLATIGAEPVR